MGINKEATHYYLLTKSYIMQSQRSLGETADVFNVQQAAVNISQAGICLLKACLLESGQDVTQLSSYDELMPKSASFLTPQFSSEMGRLKSYANATDGDCYKNVHESEVRYIIGIVEYAYETLWEKYLPNLADSLRQMAPPALYALSDEELIHIMWKEL